MYSRDEMGIDTPPEMNDTATASRTASLVVFVAALWFFVAPWAYYGVSDRTSAWNCWIVGALMVAFAAARLWHPLYSKAGSWANMVLAIWVLVSPWICGYTEHTAQFINSLTVGAVVFALSIASARTTRGSAPISFSPFEDQT